MPKAPDASARIRRSGDGKFVVDGELSHTSVPELWELGRTDFGQDREVDIHLGAVTRCDSAGAAMIVDWIRSIEERGGRVRLHGVPAQMRAIFHVSDLDELLPFDAADG